MTQPVQFATRWNAVAGRRVHARVGGLARPAGPPVVLVHGLAAAGRSVLPTACVLAAEHRVLVPDLPGFGRSAAPPGVPDVAGLAALLAAWLDETLPGGEPVALVGASLGAQIAVELAILRPQRVAAVVLLGPSPDPANRALPRLLWATLRDVPRERPALILAVHPADDLRAGPRRLWSTLRHLLAHPMADRLSLVRAPALVLRGERDPICTAPWAGAVAARLPRARLATVPGAGHALADNSPTAVAARVAAFLRDLDPVPWSVPGHAADAASPDPAAPSSRRRR